MKTIGKLHKMESRSGTPVNYNLIFENQTIEVNSLLGKQIDLKFTGKIYCSHCGKVTKKSYAQGHCFPCSIKLAECDMCILKPETCHFHLGTCREPKWGEEHCMKPHIVYLANSSGIKVGITRKSQVPFRWIDQGASFALPMLEVKTRLISGQVEVLFKKHISDKTDWRKMLKGNPEEIDLEFEKKRLLNELSKELSGIEHTILDLPVQKFEYPVLQYPEKISSLGLDKHPHINSKLVGIKGQYLLFESGVLNVRNHSGYEVELEAN